jgi:serine/threonine protein kinase
MEVRQTDVCAACGWVEGTPAENPIHLRPRTQLHDHYIVGRVLGHGGFGIAYLAWDTNLHMKVALKEFFPGDYATRGVDRSTVTPYTGDSREHFEYGLSKFLEEGRAVARFNDHPGIVPVLNFFRENGTGYLVMQYVPGMSLKQYLLLKGGRIPYDEALSLVMPVMDTLRAVHEEGLLHRDISPDNIYISATRRVKLLDFGAARLALGDRSKSLSVILKAGYAPFEQYQARGRQGPWTDVYALASTIYRATTGQPPPEAPSRVAGEELATPRALGVVMPANAEAVLLRALAVDQHDRFQQVRDFQQALLDASQAPRAPERDRPAIDGVPWNNDETRRETRPGERASGNASPFAGPSPRHVAAAAGTAAPEAARAWAADGGPTPMPKPAPPPAPKAFGDYLQAVVGMLAAPAQQIETALADVTGLRPAPDERASGLRQGALIAAAIVGGFGVLWTLSLLSVLGTSMLSGTNIAALVGGARAAAGCLGAGLMALGGIAGLAGDRRGVSIAWTAGWFLILFGAAGSVLQLLTYLPYLAFSLIGVFAIQEFTTLAQSLLPTGVVLLLLWLRPSSGAPRVG